MAIRFDDIANRLKAFRLGSGMSADEVAKRLGISRTALYRFERGEVAKIETLERLSELLDVSVPTLLGVGVEYVANVVSYFERIRQLEETAEQITVLAAPVSYVLTTDSFDETLGSLLEESISEDSAGEARERALEQLALLMEILSARKQMYKKRRPHIVNLASVEEITAFLRNGLIGRHDVSEPLKRRRRELARQEMEHFANLMETEPIGIQVGLVRETLPHSGFLIFRQPDRKVLSVSSFRLSERPNIQVGVSMFTSAPEALELHEKMIENLWSRALKGAAAGQYLRELIERHSD